MGEKRVVIVTGASRGIGAATAGRLASEGACVSLMSRTGEDLQGVAENIEQLGGRALAVRAETADPEQCREVFEKTMATFGRLDALVVNAGMVEPLQRIATADPELWRYNIEVNLLGPFYMARAVLPELRRTEGRIVFVSSGAARIPIIAASAYCASKAGLTHFSNVLALEEPRLTVLAVRPGVVDTAMQERLREEGPGVMPPEQAAYYWDIMERGELEPPDVPGRALAWLALHAPAQWSGSFLDYDDPRITRASRGSFKSNES